LDLYSYVGTDILEIPVQVLRNFEIAKLT